jgi:proline iminopeptidase
MSSSPGAVRTRRCTGASSWSHSPRRSRLDAHEATLAVAGGGLFLRSIGAGPPLVVVHGGPDFDHEYLLPEFDDLVGDRRVVLYDQRGRGRSFQGEGPDDVTLGSEMADLDAVRAWTGMPVVALLGHSFGGLLAMEYAIRFPDRVSHLVLLNTAPASYAGAGLLRAELAARTSPERAARMAEISADPAYQRGDVAPEAERYRLHFGRTVRDPAVLDDVVGRLRRAFTPASIVAARAIEDRLYAETWDRPGYDLLPALRRLATPTLVVHGEHDFVPLAISREIAKAIPRSRLAILRTSHFSYVEQPAEVGALVERFLAGP